MNSDEWMKLDSTTLKNIAKKFGIKETRKFEIVSSLLKKIEEETRTNVNVLEEKIEELKNQLKEARCNNKVPAERSEYMSSDTSSVRSGGSTPSSPNDDGLDDGVVPPATATGRQAPRTRVTQKSRESFIANGNNNGGLSGNQIPQSTDFSRRDW